MGVPAHCIPISGLTHGVENGSELTTYPGFEDFKKHIYKKGLNPENINNSGKTYIFQDYCDSGATLKKFEEFIRSDEMGLNSENVVFEGVYQTFQKGAQKVPFDEFYKIFRSITHLAAQNTPLSFKQYTNIPKLDCHQLGKIAEINYNASSQHAEFIECLKTLISSMKNQC